MSVNKSLFYGVGIFFLVVLAAIFMVGGGFSKQNSGDSASGGKDFQEVVLSMKGYNYYPNTIEVKAGAGVRIKLDESVRGCFRDLVLRDFGIHQYLKTPDDYVELVPEKPGEYKFSCSMGMGYGTLIVK